MQSEKTSLHEVEKGKEVAISLPGVNFERQLQGEEYLYSNISAYDYLNFKKNKELLSQDEIRLLQEIASSKEDFPAPLNPEIAASLNLVKSNSGALSPYEVKLESFKETGIIGPKYNLKTSIWQSQTFKRIEEIYLANFLLDMNMQANM